MIIIGNLTVIVCIFTVKMLYSGIVPVNLLDCTLTYMCNPNDEIKVILKWWINIVQTLFTQNGID